MNALLRIGDFCLSPWRSLRAFASGQRFADPADVIWGYLLVQLTIQGRLLYRHLVLLDTAPRITLRRVIDSLWMASRDDVFVWVIALALVGSYGRWLRKPRWHGRGTAAAVTYLFVPLVAAKALSQGVALLGFDAWWMPHHPISSWAVLVNGRFDLFRYLSKIGILYGPSVPLLVGWWWGQRGAASPPAHEDNAAATDAHTPPVVAPAERGVPRTVVAMGWMALLFVSLSLRVADVARHADRLRPALPGMSFPSAKLRYLEARPEDPKGWVEIQSFQGDIVVLDFWASWCAPCLRSIPELSALSDEFSGQGVHFLGVNREPENLSAATDAWRKLDPRFPSLWDDRRLGEQLGVSSLPTTMVLDRKGVLRYLHLGYTPSHQLRSELRSVLAAQPDD